jgi:uncharacterized lipoprotein YddW (UPF0748 family)
MQTVIAMSDFGLAVWSHRISDFGSEREIDEHVERLADAGFDLLIPCVKNPPGAVDFLTDLAEVNESYPEWDPLRVLIDRCTERGLDVHPWFCVFPEGEKSRLLNEHPEYEAEMDGNRRWACACRPEVQDYAFDLYRDLADRYSPPGLHLDYIRTGGACRCEYCREEMKRRGVDIGSVEWRDPDSEVWTNWRASRIADFVTRVHDLTSGAGMELSAAVFNEYPRSISGQGQDWVQWAELGIVDYLFPMSYTNSLLSVVSRTICHVALVGGRVPVWEGLGKYSSASQLTPEALGEQIRGVLDRGADGVVIFHYGAITDDDLEEIGNIRAERT